MLYSFPNVPTRDRECLDLPKCTYTCANLHRTQPVGTDEKSSSIIALTNQWVLLSNAREVLWQEIWTPSGGGCMVVVSKREVSRVGVDEGVENVQGAPNL
jgi:hypothetical protein